VPGAKPSLIGIDQLQTNKHQYEMGFKNHGGSRLIRHVVIVVFRITKSCHNMLLIISLGCGHQIILLFWPANCVRIGLSVCSVLDFLYGTLHT